MTDSVLQFNYSDNVHIVSIYIRSDTHEEDFIPFLCDVIKTCEHTSRNRSWNYTVAEIVAKIINKYDSGVKFIFETKDKDCRVIYKHTISILDDYYNYDFSFNNSNVKLIDYVIIDSKYPISKNKIFKGKIVDYYNKIIKDNNTYLIKELEEEIKEKQEHLNGLKNII